MSASKTEEESASEEAPAPPPQKSHEPKTSSKVIRVLTVSAYLFSVSFAAILLSIYYICIWKSPTPPISHGRLSALRGDIGQYHHAIVNITRGGDSAVNETSFTEFLNSTTETYEESTTATEQTHHNFTQSIYNRTLKDLGTNDTNSVT